MSTTDPTLAALAERVEALERRIGAEESEVTDMLRRINALESARARRENTERNMDGPSEKVEASMRRDDEARDAPPSPAPSAPPSRDEPTRKECARAIWAGLHPYRPSDPPDDSPESTDHTAAFRAADRIRALYAPVLAERGETILELDRNVDALRDELVAYENRLHKAVNGKAMVGTMDAVGRVIDYIAQIERERDAALGEARRHETAKDEAEASERAAVNELVRVREEADRFHGLAAERGGEARTYKEQYETYLARSERFLAQKLELEAKLDKADTRARELTCRVPPFGGEQGSPCGGCVECLYEQARYALDGARAERDQHAAEAERLRGEVEKLSRSPRAVTAEDVRKAVVDARAGLAFANYEWGRIAEHLNACLLAPAPSAAATEPPPMCPTCGHAKNDALAVACGDLFHEWRAFLGKPSAPPPSFQPDPFKPLVNWRGRKLAGEYGGFQIMSDPTVKPGTIEARCEPPPGYEEAKPGPDGRGAHVLLPSAPPHETGPISDEELAYRLQTARNDAEGLERQPWASYSLTTRQTWIHVARLARTLCSAREPGSVDVEGLLDGLFTNGHRQKADRLVMVSDRQLGDLGGWSREAVRQRILKHLAPAKIRMPEREKLAVETLVQRFLAWPLPETVCADLCATKFGYPDRTGTNLLDHSQAKAMFEHCLKDPS